MMNSSLLNTALSKVPEFSQLQNGGFFHNYVCKRLPDIHANQQIIMSLPEAKPPFSDAFSLIFPWKHELSHDFPMCFLWKHQFSHDFPMKTSVFPWFSYNFPMTTWVVPWFSRCFCCVSQSLGWTPEVLGDGWASGELSPGQGPRGGGAEEAGAHAPWLVVISMISMGN